MKKLAPLFLLLVGCSAATTQTLIADISDAVCTELEANQQTDTSAVQFICSVADPKGGAPKTFKVSVKKDSIKKFATGCPSASPKVAP